MSDNTTPQPTAPVIDLTQFRAPKNYVWREIEREGREPLRVELLDLTIAETNAIPWGVKVPLRESYQAVAPYVVGWTFEAENIITGEIVAVPPPAVAGWEAFELLTNVEASAIVNWLKIPHYMKAEEEKKASPPSTTTSASRKRNG